MLLASGTSGKDGTPAVDEEKFHQETAAFASLLQHKDLFPVGGGINPESSRHGDASSDTREGAHLPTAPPNSVHIQNHGYRTAPPDGTGNGIPPVVNLALERQRFNLFPNAFRGFHPQGGFDPQFMFHPNDAFFAGATHSPAVVQGPLFSGASGLPILTSPNAVFLQPSGTGFQQPHIIIPFSPFIFAAPNGHGHLLAPIPNQGDAQEPHDQTEDSTSNTSQFRPANSFRSIQDFEGFHKVEDFPTNEQARAAPKPQQRFDHFRFQSPFPKRRTPQTDDVPKASSIGRTAEDAHPLRRTHRRQKVQEEIPQNDDVTHEKNASVSAFVRQQ